MAIGKEQGLEWWSDGVLEWWKRIKIGVVEKNKDWSAGLRLVESNEVLECWD